MPWLVICVVVYALLMLGGGVGGYVTARSTPSLITGIVAGLLLLGSAAWAKSNPKMGFGLATLVTAGLIAVFVRRYIETGKPMPSLGLVGLSVLMLILLLAGHFLNRSAR